MEQKKIDRINFLARKSRAEGITAEEKQEQKVLRQEYIDGYRRNLTQTLENTVIVDEHGNRKKLRKNGSCL